ncbi:MAG: WG repeat-containing protein [Saprospiraceae bacterium]
MQKFLFLLIVIFSVQSTFAQSTLRKQKKDGKWGFVDTSGSVIIDYQYQNVHNFYQNVTLVKKDNLWGFINNKGEVIVPLAFSEVKKYTGTKVVRAKKEEFWYLYNLKGKLIVDEKFEMIHPIVSKKMAVKLNGKMGLMDIDGNLLIKPKYQEVAYFGGNMVRVKKRGKYGYRTIENKRAIPIKYEDLGRFYGTRVKAKRKGKWGMIDKKGKRILKFKFDYIGEYAYDSYLKDYYAPYVYGTRVGKISSWGASVPFEYEEVVDAKERLNDNLVRIRFGKDFGAVDNNGKVVIMPFYKNRFTFNDGYAAVSDGKKFGFINSKGKVVYPFILDTADNFENDEAKVMTNGESKILKISDLNK